MSDNDTENLNRLERMEMGETTHGGPIRMDLPEVERDDAGIPTFIFKDELKQADQKRVQLL